MTDAKGRTVADLVAACDAMALRARAERTERNRVAQLDARNLPPPVDVEVEEREPVVAAVVIELDRWQSRGAG